MKTSTERILATHVGSLPRPPAVVDCLVRKERGDAYDGAEFAPTMKQGIAGTDCGFGTFAGYGKVDGKIAFKKLGSLAEGATLASKRLWS